MGFILLPRRSITTRILPLRPLRPPAIATPPRRIHRARLFTHNLQLLLIASHTPRPQLPFLSPPLSGPSQQVARLISTETRTYVKEVVTLATKFTVLGYTFLALAAIAYYGYLMEASERRNPTPDEWRWWTRQQLRVARDRMSKETAQQVGYIDWYGVRTALVTVLERLEDPAKEGKGLIEGGGEGEDIMIEGVGKGGFDISAKSWPWRACYFETLMGLATAAEHLDNKVLDTTRDIVFPKVVVVGPSNADPRPTPPYMQTAPLEKNCVEASPTPEVYYVKILTGKGFTTKQRSQAASSYANWLEFKNLPESAEEMHRWAVDIAISGLPSGVNPDRVIDRTTAVLKAVDATYEVTPNLLRATTDLAIHHASNGNVSAALPIFLSVLRARRSSPVSPYPPPTEPAPLTSKSSSFLGFIAPAKFPEPPPSGDSPFVRSTDKPTCEEGELMLYIGEILFASGQSSEEGMRWTKQAVNIADTNLSNLPPTSSAEEEVIKCKECLLTGVKNWDVMLRRVVANAGAPESVKKSGWFSWGSAGQVGAAVAEYEEQQKQVDSLKERFLREDMEQQVTSARGNPNPSGVWLG